MVTIGEAKAIDEKRDLPQINPPQSLLPPRPADYISSLKEAQKAFAADLDDEIPCSRGQFHSRHTATTLQVAQRYSENPSARRPLWSIVRSRTDGPDGRKADVGKQRVSRTAQSPACQNTDVVILPPSSPLPFEISRSNDILPP